MKILKTSVLLLLTLALLFGFACLPRLVGYATDTLRQDRAGYHSIQPIALELQQRRRLTALQKLYLIQFGEALNATEEDVVMPAEEVQAAVGTALDRYFDAGLLRGWDRDNYTLDCRPVLAFDTLTGLYDYSWIVLLQQPHDEAPYGQLNISIDDETGKMTGIYFWVPEPVFESEELPGLLETMCMIFLDELDLPQSYEVQDITVSKESCSIRYTCNTEAVDGMTLSFSLDFCMFPQGFYLQQAH